MHRRDLSVLACLAALVVVAAPAPAANVAAPAVNPNARVAGTTTFGNVGFTNNLNDGAQAVDDNGSLYQVPSSGSRGFGYDLGGVAVIESLDLSQYIFTPIGVRSRLQNVVVHTSAGRFPFTLPDQDDVTITFPSPIATAWVAVETVTQHPGNDAQIGIDELAVNSLAGVVLPGRTNVALGRPFTLQGGGWNNINGNLTDNVLAGANNDLSTAMFNSSPTAAGVGIDVDLGTRATMNGIGLAEQDFGGAGGRQLIQSARLEFSDDPGFATVTDMRALTLENVAYQQVDFAPAAGRYVRLSFQSVYPNPDSNLGFTELQLFQVPEPSAFALAVPALWLLARRRRR